MKHFKAYHYIAVCTSVQQIWASLQTC